MAGAMALPLAPASTKAEPSGWTDSGMSLLLLWISSRPERQSVPGFCGGDQTEVPLRAGDYWCSITAELLAGLDRAAWARLPRVTLQIPVRNFEQGGPL